MESQKGSLILFVKDMDKLVMACTDVKDKLKALPINVVAIASHTHEDTEKDKACDDLFSNISVLKYKHTWILYLYICMTL